MKRFLTFVIFAASLSAQQPGAGEFINQLAAPKVRLRDEAQKALAAMPEAEPEMRAAMDTHPSEEARLRLKRLVKTFHDGQWKIEWQQDTATGGTERGAMRATSDGRFLANLHSGGIEMIETQDFHTVRTQGRDSKSPLVTRVLAMSGDGRRLAQCNTTASFIIEDDTGARLRALAGDSKTVTNFVNGAKKEIIQTVVPVAAEFLPGGERLLVLSNAGLTLHDPASPTPRRASLQNLFPSTTRNLNASALAVSADGKMAGVAVDVGGPDDRLMAMVSLPTMTVAWSCKFSVLARWIAVNHDGSEALIAMRERGVVRCAAGSPLATTVSRSIDDLTSVAYAPDEKSAFITSARANAPIRQLALPGGEEIWTAPPSHTGYHRITVLGPDRFAAKTDDNLIVVWKRREPPAKKPAR